MGAWRRSARQGRDLIFRVGGGRTKMDGTRESAQGQGPLNRKELGQWGAGEERQKLAPGKKTLK